MPTDILLNYDTYFPSLLSTTTLTIPSAWGARISLRVLGALQLSPKAPDYRA